MSDDNEAIFASMAAVAMGLVEHYFAKKGYWGQRKHDGGYGRAARTAARKKREPTLHEMLADLD